MRFTVKMKGVNRFIRDVKQQTPKMQKAVSQELNRSSLRVERTAKKIAPYDTGWMTNNIYSIMISPLLFEIRSPTEYSLFVEDGTRYMMAQPFMRPALKMEHPVLLRNLRRIVGG